MILEHDFCLSALDGFWKDTFGDLSKQLEALAITVAGGGCKPVGGAGKEKTGMAKRRKIRKKKKWAYKINIITK